MAIPDAEVLARSPLFAELSDAELRALARVAVRRTLQPGEALFFAGDEAQGLHIVIGGRMKVFVVSPGSGREVILTVDRPYNAVAELVALDGGTYPANAEALEETELLVLEQEGFQDVLRQQPDIALHLLRVLGRRLRRLVNLVEAISFQEVVHRLARYLLEQGEPPFPLATNADIAAELGTVPELVSRNLSRLVAGGVIGMQGRTVLTLERRRLQEMADSVGR